jgi:hypothetical protein
MQPSGRELCGGHAKVLSVLDKQRIVKDGRLEKKSPTSKVTKALISAIAPVHKKKSVNGYMIFRCWFSQFNIPVVLIY